MSSVASLRPLREALSVVFLLSFALFARGAEPKHRLLVCTDITSIETGVLEPDDAESLVRLLVSCNSLDLEGLVASSTLEHGQSVRPDLILKAIDAYAKDLPNLRQHDPAYPDAAYLAKRVFFGQKIAGRKVPREESMGEGKTTNASRAIIEAVDRPGPRPLWIACWGGTADVAQALYTVQRERTPAELEKFLAKMRLHVIGEQDSTFAWIDKEFPTLFIIHRVIGARGMYRNGDPKLCDTAWVQKHVKGHGALGDFYPIYDGGDKFSAKLGQVRGLKEGDSASFLNLLSGDPMKGWGGTFIQTAPQRFTDEKATDAQPTDLDPTLAGVYRHRAAFQADFAQRMDWCKE